MFLILVSLYFKEEIFQEILLGFPLRVVLRVEKGTKNTYLDTRLLVSFLKSCINRRRTGTFSLDTHSWHNPTNSKALSVQFTLTASCVYTERLKGMRERERARKGNAGENSCSIVSIHMQSFILAHVCLQKQPTNYLVHNNQSNLGINQAWWFFMEILTQWSCSWSTDTEGSLRSSGTRLNGCHSACNESWISETQNFVGSVVCSEGDTRLICWFTRCRQLWSQVRGGGRLVGTLAVTFMFARNSQIQHLPQRFSDIYTCAAIVASNQVQYTFQWGLCCLLSLMLLQRTHPGTFCLLF